MLCTGMRERSCHDEDERRPNTKMREGGKSGTNREREKEETLKRNHGPNGTACTLQRLPVDVIFVSFPFRWYLTDFCNREYNKH